MESIFSMYFPVAISGVTLIYVILTHRNRTRRDRLAEVKEKIRNLEDKYDKCNKDRDWLNNRVKSLEEERVLLLTKIVSLTQNPPKDPPLSHPPLGGCA